MTSSLASRSLALAASLAPRRHGSDSRLASACAPPPPPRGRAPPPGARRLPRVAQPRFGLPHRPRLLLDPLPQGVGVPDEAQGEPAHPRLTAAGPSAAARPAAP